MKSTRSKGNVGEDIAINLLEAKGYEIKKKNFHFGRKGEIDIVAFDGEYIVFVEVKMRNNDNFGDPLSSLTPIKQRNLRRAAEGYLYVNKLENVPCRFDVIVIDARKNLSEIKHIENAF